MMFYKTKSYPQLPQVKVRYNNYMEKKNKAAQALGRKRWKGKSKEERSAHAKMMANAKYDALRKTHPGWSEDQLEEVYEHNSD